MKVAHPTNEVPIITLEDLEELANKNFNGLLNSQRPLFDKLTGITLRPHNQEPCPNCPSTGAIKVSDILLRCLKPL
jgi:hypothetical protein